MPSPQQFLQLEQPRILIVRLSALGDVLRVLPALSVLRQHFPQAYIGWALEKPFASLLEGHPEVDDFFFVPRGSSRTGHVRALGKELAPLIRRIRNQQFELTIDFHGILKSGIISRLSGAKVRIGYTWPYAREGNFLFNNYRIALPGHQINRVERNLLLLQGLGLNDRSYAPHLPRPEIERRFIQAFLQDAQLTDGPFVLLYPGTSRAGRAKRWPVQWWVELARALSQRSLAKLLLGWGPDDRDIVASILAQNPPLQLAPETSLPQLAELIRRASLFIGGDTGPMHMAWIVKTPLIAFFGPSNPVQNTPPPQAKFRLISEKHIDQLRRDSVRREALVTQVLEAARDLMRERKEEG